MRKKKTRKSVLESGGKNQQVNIQTSLKTERFSTNTRAITQYQNLAPTIQRCVKDDLGWEAKTPFQKSKMNQL